MTSKFSAPSDCRYDAIVIGGGPAGATTALYLARFRRKVLVVDDGHSRAMSIPRSHNLAGYPDGIAGTALMAALRQQARRYGVEFAAGRVTAQHQTEWGFLAERSDAASLQARTLVLATGASDVTPAMPYFAEAVASGALRYCPVCDGYEVSGQRVGVLANDDAGAREALYLRAFTEHLTLFRTSPEVEFGVGPALDEAGVVVVADPVVSLRLWDGRIVVRHGDGETPCDSVYSALGMRVHSELVPAADRDDAGYLVTDCRQQTTIEGIYAVGDVSQGLNQICVAMGEGAIAAAAIHRALGRNW